MKKFENFLFFYSIVAITVFLISFGIFSPKPLNFISGLLLLPLVFYYWIRLTNPENVSAERWSLRFLTALIILSLLGIYGFYLLKQVTEKIPVISNQLSNEQRLNEELKKELANLKEKLEKVENEKKDCKTCEDEVTVSDLLLE